MIELRPNIGPELAFAEHVDKVLRPEGYRLVGFFVKKTLSAVAVAGFRIVNYLAWGHALYCDDLGTRFEHRKQGYAGQLMDWMIDEAKRLHLDELHLDSGVGPDRTASTSTSACGSQLTTSPDRSRCSGPKKRSVLTRSRSWRTRSGASCAR